jgi:hypothetical protein
MSGDDWNAADSRAHVSNCCASDGAEKCRFANARPEPDLRYRSKRAAGEPLVNIRGAANVMTRRVAVASEDVDESSANASHGNRCGRIHAGDAKAKFRETRFGWTRAYADAAALDGNRVREICYPLRSLQELAG